MIVKRSITFATGGGALVLAALALAACGGGSGTSASSGPPKTAGGLPATVGVESTSLGNILDNTQGRTLYLFTADSGTMSACSGACAANWPPLRAPAKPTSADGAKTSFISTTPRTGGTRQVTYKGHPLYLFKGDSKAGQTNGEGVNAFGGNWYAVSPAGSQVVQTSNSGGGGGGY